MFRIIVFLFFTGILILGCQVKDLDNSAKYNIVWISIEDQSPQFFPMYGDSTVKLPALEALAEESIIYDHAFANVPVCAPARSTIILGQYVSYTGTHNMRTFNAYNPDNEVSIGVPSYTPVMDPNVREFTKYLRAEGYYCTNNAKEDFNFQKTDGVYDESSPEASFRNRKEGQAFFHIFNAMVTHESVIWRLAEDSLYIDPSLVVLPPYFPDTDSIRHDLAVNYSNLVRMDRQVEALIAQLKEDQLYDEAYIIFFSDHGGPFPRHKRSLYDTGIKVPMMIKLPKSLQTANDPKRNNEIVSFVDLAPTMLSICGIEIPDYMHGRPFLGDNKEPEPEYFYGSSDRFDEVYDRRRVVRNKQYKYIRNYRPELSRALPVSYREQMPLMRELRRMKATNSLKGVEAIWMNDSKETEELYDLSNDPWELRNLFEDPNYKNVLDEFRNALEDWQTEYRDLGELAEQELIKRWEDKRAEVLLEAPILKDENEQKIVLNPNEYGHLLYQTDQSENWQVYNSGFKLDSEKSYRFKVVHIGLEDSPILNLN